MTDRFSAVNSEDKQSVVNKSKNSNTTKATSRRMRVFNSWAALRGKVRPIYLLSLIDPDKVLQSFYAEVRKTNGNEYEPNSLASMQPGIGRYLKENNYHVSIIRDRVFSASRAAIEGKCKNLRKDGKGKRANKSLSLLESEVNISWECGQLGTHSSMSLINTIWWLFTLHIRLRGQQEHHPMTVSDFQFKKDDFGNEFVTFAKGITKTRQSGLHQKHRLIQPKKFSTDNSRCPVNIFKPYLSKRPSQLRPSATEAVNKNPVHFQQSHSKPWVILANDERVKNLTFNFLDQKWAPPKSANYYFDNCTVGFYNGENSVQHQNHNRKCKKCVIYSSDSSDEY